MSTHGSASQSPRERRPRSSGRRVGPVAALAGLVAGLVAVSGLAGLGSTRAGAAASILPGGARGQAEASTSAAPAAAVPSAAGAVPITSFRPAALRWTTCSDQPSFQCARMQVPLDTVKGGAARISLSILKVPATRSSGKLGALFVNPGGPGGSARDFAAQLADSRSLAKLRERYDVIGWDPRGVGSSSPIRCLDPAGYTRFYAADPTPDDAAETNELVTVSKQFVAGCVARNGAELTHVSTEDTVADLEWIRQAMGLPKVSFLGFSYGTYLALRYADRFPDRVGRFVLDGVLDPSVDGATRLRLQAAGFERGLNDFLQTCGRTRCTFVHDGETPSKAYDRVMAVFETSPMTVSSPSGKRTVGPGEAMTGVLAALYNVEAGWPRLRTALNQADDGNAAGLLSLFDIYADRSPNGTYGNVSDANAAVNCADLPADHDVASYQRLAKDLGASYPRFGAFAAYSSMLCAFWPISGGAPRGVRAVGAAPMLLVGTTRDPATPYPWALSVQKQLGTARLLTYDGDGHTAFLTGNACVRSAVERYLLDGGLPDEGTICDS